MTKQNGYVNNLEAGNATLNIEEYQFYYDAIRNDDVTEIQEAFRNADVNIPFMLNSKFDLDRNPQPLNRTDLNHYISLPLHTV